MLYKVKFMFNGKGYFKEIEAENETIARQKTYALIDIVLIEKPRSGVSSFMDIFGLKK